MGSSRRLRHASRDANSTSDLGGWLQRVVLAGCMALTVLAVLIPSEAAIPEGSFAPLAAGWCLLLVLWTASLWLTPSPQPVFGWTELAVATLVLWHTLAAIVHLFDGNARRTLHALWLVVSYGVAVLLWRQMLRPATRVQILLLLMLWLATTLAGWGVFQTAYSFPRLRREYAQNPTQLLVEQGLPAEAGSPHRELFENRLQSTEPLASFALTNSLAGFLAPWLIVAVWWAADLPHVPQRRPIAIAIGVAAALLGLCLLLTKSRTAYLATALGLGLIPLVRRLAPHRNEGTASASNAPRFAAAADVNENPKNSSLGGTEHRATIHADPAVGSASLFRWPAMAGGAVLVAVTLAIAAGWLDWKVLAEAPLSIRYRLEYWQATLQIIREQPLWGCGPGNFQTAYAHFKLPHSSEMVADPHNVLLEMAATAGLPAVGLLLGTVAAFLWDLWRSRPFVGNFRPQVGGEVGPRASLRREAVSSETAALRLENALYWGAFIGLLAAVPLGFAVGLTLETWAGLPVAWWLGMPLLLGVWWAGRYWLPKPSMIPLTMQQGLVLALVVLGLHLQAAGALVFPGVIMTFIVLVPAALALSEAACGGQESQIARFKTDKTEISRISKTEAVSKTALSAWPTALVRLASPRSNLVKIGATLSAIALFGASLTTEYYPVLRCRSAVEQARALWQAGQVDAAEQRLRAACLADPHDPQPWELLAELRLVQWLSEPSDQNRAGFLEAAQEFIRRDPRNHVAWFTRGHWFVRIWSKSQSNKDLESAIEAYQAAVRFYPHRALYHAQLAWTFYVAGQPEQAREQAERAWSLDQQMPHREQKLNRQKLFTVRRDGELQAAGPSGLPEESAEQTVDWLRKLSVKPAESGARREGAR